MPVISQPLGNFSATPPPVVFVGETAPARPAPVLPAKAATFLSYVQAVLLSAARRALVPMTTVASMVVLCVALGYAFGKLVLGA